jgi:putative transposase
VDRPLRARRRSGLTDRSRRPQSCPHATPPLIVDAVLEARRHHPRWGAKKLLRILRRKDPRESWPARTTACDLPKRHDLIPKTRRQPRLSHPGHPSTPMTEANGIWTADVKGQFKTRDSIYCYPLTLVDGYSRYLRACQGLRSTVIVLARAIFRRAFEEYGLPNIIRSDNGVPFATTALGRLSLLSVWWIRLGIIPELIQPAHPEQNGRHERMHRTLKAEATRPPSGNLRAQQVRFNRFRAEYNDERPHEALDQETRHPCMAVATRAAAHARAPGIPGHFEIRLVSRNSGIRWKKH